MPTNPYRTPIAFKTAIEQRLKNTTVDGRDLQRRRQLLVFDRFLARVMTEFGDAIVLKGGLVLELRLERARSTKDIDVRISGAPDQLLARLQRAGRLDSGDFMSFEVAHPRQATIQGDGVKYEGVRFRVECRLAGKLYGQAFGLDVGIGDPMIREPDIVLGPDWLGFAGISPPQIRLYPVETHIAEKLHAYTMPRTRPNSRIKDLPDIALLAGVGPLSASRVSSAIEQTFGFRATHPAPPQLPAPPSFWEAPYAEMAREFELRWATLAACYSHACRFLDPVLATQRSATWNPQTCCWAPSKND